jgi:hypothetical protein
LASNDRGIRILVPLASIALFVSALELLPRVTSADVKSPIGDTELHSAVIADVQRGQAFHDAFGFELRRLHYPARSIFNWRQPLLSWTLAFVPHGEWILYAVGALLLLSAWLTQRRWWTLLLLLPTLLPIGTTAIVFPELWSGMLLGVSAVAYIGRQPLSGVACAMLALAIRDLAAPYCVGLTLYAAWRRDWREVSAWMMGLLLYVLYYGWHLWKVLAHIQPNDVAHPRSWVALGGLTFLLRVLQFTNPLFMAWPVVFACAMACGALAWAGRVPSSLRIGLLIYVPFFLIVGQPFNVYWGFMIAPLFALWLSYAPDGVAALLARRPEPAPPVGRTANLPQQRDLAG